MIPQLLVMLGLAKLKKDQIEQCVNQKDTPGAEARKPVRKP